MDNKDIKVVDFTDRSKAGWDVYFAIDCDTKDDEKMRVFDGLARALIVSSNPKDKFFVNITKIISEDIEGHIKTVLEDHEYCPEGSLVYNGLKKYADKDSGPAAYTRKCGKIHFFCPCQ